MTLTHNKSHFPERTVARPVANLGNTCYMNCVLQALAACPELCMALDCCPHRSSCPIYGENMAKSRASSPYSNASAGSDAHHSLDSSSSWPLAAAPPRKAPTATRKSLRSSGRRTPLSDDGKHSDWTFCALCELEEHLHQVHAGGDDAARQPVAPNAFVHGFMEHVAPWFELGQQEDSHEFLRLLIDAMQKSCAQARPREIKPAVLDDDSPTATRTRSSSRQRNSNIRAASPTADTEYPFSLFRGMVESTVTCEYCQATSSTRDPIEDIGLEVVLQPGSAAPSGSATRPEAAPLPSSTTTATRSSSRNVSPAPAPSLADVTAAFQRFTRPESLDAGYRCEKCHKEGRATKTSRLAELPPILTLHLKRFRYGGEASRSHMASRRSAREVGQLLSGQSPSDVVYTGGSGSAKIEGHIKFDRVLDLSPYTTQQLQEKQKNMICRLFAVLVHAGKNSHSGHYIAYVRSQADKKEEWWKMDDGRITKVDFEQVKKAEAYMLFYRVLAHPIAEQLRKEYKARKDEARLLEERARQQQDSEGPPPRTRSDPANVRKRPRREPAFSDGESWARARTRSQATGSPLPQLIEIVNHVQEQVAQETTLTKEGLAKLDAQVTQEEQEPQSNPPRQNKAPVLAIHEDVEVDSDGFGNKLRKLFHTLTAKDGLSGMSKWLAGGDTAEKNPAQDGVDDQRVAVVEPDDDDMGVL